MPKTTVKLIQAMYKDNRSITRINDTISPLYNTYSGLQQGALSSHMLFNLYINDLMTKLNQNMPGAKIKSLNITNLLFADDIVLTTTDKKALQELLDTCTK